MVTKEERIIDYNELIRAKLKTLIESEDYNGAADPDGFVNGLTADVVERLTDENTILGEGENAEEAFSPEDIARKIEEANQESAQIIEDANLQAQKMIEDAQGQIQESMSQAKEQGYQEGITKATRELELRQEQLENEIQDRRSELEAEYEQRRKQMEPELVEALLEVFQSFTLVLAQDNKDILMHLINGVLANSYKSDEILVKVSCEDYPFVSANQGKIFCASTKELSLNIIEDSTMEANQCIIETDSGIFDCSLDTELSNLTKKIKLLSCLE